MAKPTPAEILAALKSTPEGRALLDALTYLSRQSLSPAENVDSAQRVQKQVNQNVIDLYQRILGGKSGAEDINQWMNNMVAANVTGLRELASELIERDEPLPAPLTRLLLNPPPPPAAKPGPKRVHMAVRDAAIVRAVNWIVQEHKFKPTRNRAARDKPGAAESGCSIVSSALAFLGVYGTEDAVEKIWQRR